MPSRVVVLSSILLTAAGCTGSSGPKGPEGEIAVGVGALSFPDLADACYGITIKNPDGGTVVDLDGICADQYGDLESSITYVAPCDASYTTNTVSLVLESLEDTTGPVDVASYVNPCGDPTVASTSPDYNYDGFGPCTRVVPCTPNADSPVVFDLTVMRSAGQGFLDMMVNFEDIFCSAKADCVDPGTGLPIQLLFEPGTTNRIPTAVLALACTTGDAPANTNLHFTALTLTCQGQAPITIPLHGAAGNQYSTTTPAPAPLSQVGIYRDVEELINTATGQPAGKIFQNVALGFQLDGDPRSCSVSLAATATNGPLDECTLETATVYPTINWQVDLTNGTGTGFACTQHPIDATPLDDVFTAYPTTSPTFTTTVTASGTSAVAAPCDGGVTPPATGTITGLVYYEFAQPFMGQLPAGRPIFVEGAPGECRDPATFDPVADCWSFYGYDAPVAPSTWDRLWYVEHADNGLLPDPVIQITGSGGYTATQTLTGNDGDYAFAGLPTNQTYCVRWMNAGHEPFNFPRWPTEPQVPLFITNTTQGGIDVADWPDQPVERCGLTVTGGATTTQSFGMTYSDDGFNIVAPEEQGDIEVYFYWEGFYAGQPVDASWPESWYDWHTPGYQVEDDGAQSFGDCDPLNPSSSTCDSLMGATLPWGYDAGVQTFDVDLSEDDGSGNPGEFIDNFQIPVAASGTQFTVEGYPVGTYCLTWYNPPSPSNTDGTEGGGFIWNSGVLAVTLWPSEPYEQWTDGPGPDPTWNGSVLNRCGIEILEGLTTEAGFGYVFHD